MRQPQGIGPQGPRWRVFCLIGLLTAGSGLGGIGCSGRVNPPGEVPIDRHPVTTRPLGIRRCHATEVELHAAGLVGKPRLVAPSCFTAERLEPDKPERDTNVFRITANADTTLGVYPVRLLSSEGFSDPFPLVVGQLPQVPEREPNDNVDSHQDESHWTAQRLSTPIVVEGTIPPKDLDCFRFRGKKGTDLLAHVFAARIGGGTDVDLLLMSLDRDFIAKIKHDLWSTADTPLFAPLPADAEYLFILDRSSYRPVKSGPPVYRLTIGAVPAAAEVFPLGGQRGTTILVTLRGGSFKEPRSVPVSLDPLPGENFVRLRVPTETPGPDGQPLDVEALPPLLVADLPEWVEKDNGTAIPELRPPIVVNGRIDPPSDVDTFAIDVQEGQTYRVNVASCSLGSQVHLGLTLADAEGIAFPPARVRAFVEEDGETGRVRWRKDEGTFEPGLEFDVPDNLRVVRLTVKEALTAWSELHGEEDIKPGGSGAGYRITIRPVEPDFSVWFERAQLLLHEGAEASVGVLVKREGFEGPITMNLIDQPPGVESAPVEIAAGETRGTLAIRLAEGKAIEPTLLQLQATSVRTQKPIVRRAQAATNFGEIATVAHKVLVDETPRGEGVYVDNPGVLRVRPNIQTGLWVATPPPRD